MSNLPANILRSVDIRDSNNWAVVGWSFSASVLEEKLCLYTVHAKQGIQYHIGRFKLELGGGWGRLQRSVSVYSNAILALDAFNVRVEEYRHRGYVVEKS